MKKLVALSLAALVAFPAFAGSATAAKKPKQTVEGTILLNQGGAAVGPCVYRTQRALSTYGGPNGIVGWMFEVDPKTAGKKFVLEVSDGAGMDIQFYADLGNPSDPTTAPANMGYETPGPGGEDGIVPNGFPNAFVCMNEGVNGSFTYTAG